MLKNRVTIGTDPEFFLVEKDSGKKISAVPIIEGTKYAPVFLSNGSKMQHDNVALEFAVEPAKDAVELSLKIRETFMLLRKDRVPKQLDIVAEPAAIFDIDQLQTLESLQFGCDPDFNAWTCSMNAPPNVGTFLRSCGGHLHIGYTEGCGCDFLLENEGKIHTIRMLDAMHGVLSVLLDKSVMSHKRRELYGKAGCFRPTHYGVEYRVLSNFWLQSPVLVTFIDQLLQEALQQLKAEKKSLFRGTKKNSNLVTEIGEDIIQTTINNSDIVSADKILNKYLVNVLSTTSLEQLHMLLSSNYKTINQEWEC